MEWSGGMVGLRCGYGGGMSRYAMIVASFINWNGLIDLPPSISKWQCDMPYRIFDPYLIHTKNTSQKHLYRLKIHFAIFWPGKSKWNNFAKCCWSNEKQHKINKMTSFMLQFWDTQISKPGWVVKYAIPQKVSTNFVHFAMFVHFVFSDLTSNRLRVHGSQSKWRNRND